MKYMPLSLLQGWLLVESPCDFQNLLLVLEIAMLLSNSELIVLSENNETGNWIYDNKYITFINKLTTILFRSARFWV